MNAIEKIRASLGVKEDVVMVMTVVSVLNGMVQLQGSGKTLNVAGNWQVGTKLIVRSSGVVESVVVESGIVVYEN